LRFLVRLVPKGSDRPAVLSAIRGVSGSLGGKAVNPKWTSSGELEIDMFAPSREDLSVVLAALEPIAKVRLLKDLQEPPRFMPKPEAVQEAVSLFDSERFWEAHEVLESLWRVAQGQEKALLQGLILVCAAFVHHQKGEDAVALGVARRALPLLEWEGSWYLGVDISELKGRMDRMATGGRLSVFKLSRRPGD
jgi:hypothetical protein